jgi:uncharacterized protein (DUF1800 family)
MLLYLDNQASIGPNSRARGSSRRGRRGRKVGINENLAREILELHTLGVDGGYTQADVTTFAQAISGWSIGGEDHGAGLRARLDNGKPGEFFFRDVLPRAGRGSLLGRTYARRGLTPGRGHPARPRASGRETARHICTKLARHFIADDPPTAVERLTRAWLDSKAHLPTVYKALVESPEAWEQPLSKFKTPADYIYSSYRALRYPAAREAARAAILRSAGAAQSDAGFAGGLARHQCGLGRILGPAQTRGVGPMSWRSAWAMRAMRANWRPQLLGRHAQR